MIINFTIMNFGPFSEPVKLSFEASTSKHLEPSYVRSIKLTNGKTIRLLRLAMIYGPNASGKSTILDALSLLDTLVTNPSSKASDKIDVNPFEFTKSKNQSTSLTIEFVRNGQVFKYQLDLVKDFILFEKLEIKKVLAYSPIYQRSRVGEDNGFVVEFGTGHKLNSAELEALNTHLLPNTTVLSVLGNKITIKNESILQAYQWFSKQLMGEVNPKTTGLTSWVTRELESDDIKKENLLVLLNQAGMPIHDLKVEDRQLEDYELDALQKADDPKAREFLLKIFKRDKQVLTSYSVDGSLYNLDLRKQESLGTQRYYGLAGLLSKLCNGHAENEHDCCILPIDEIEHSLHPDLIQHFFLTFLSDAGNSQLIVTTHYREILLDELLFRSDVIWFANKDQKSLSSELYCLEDVRAQAGLRTTSSVYNFYKHGRLGAIPNIGS